MRPSKRYPRTCEDELSLDMAGLKVRGSEMVAKAREPPCVPMVYRKSRAFCLSWSTRLTCGVGEGAGVAVGAGVGVDVGDGMAVDVGAGVGVGSSEQAAMAKIEEASARAMAQRRMVKSRVVICSFEASCPTKMPPNVHQG